MILEAIIKRFSCREFLDKPIERKKIEDIIEAGVLSPSAKNLQNWKFVAITSKNLRQQLTKVCKGQKFVSQAPLTIAICCTNLDYKMTCKIPAFIADGYIAAQNMIIQATSVGVGSCYIGAFFQNQAKELLNIPDDWMVVALIPFGYPKSKKIKRFVKPRKEVVLFNSFHG